MTVAAEAPARAVRMRLLDRLPEPPPGPGRRSPEEQRRLHDLLRRALLHD